MTDPTSPPDELSFEDAHGLPLNSAAPDELTLEQVLGAPASGNGHDADWRETLADTARGARATLPFAKDISAATRAYVGNPLTMTAPSGDFKTEKRAVEHQQDESWTRSPKAYALGATAGIFAPGGPMAKVNKLLPAAEAAVARRAAPVVGEGLARTFGAAVPVTAAGAVLGAGEGTTADERLSNALAGGAFGAVGGLAGDVAAPLVAGAGRTLDKFRDGVTPKTAKGAALATTIREANPFNLMVPEAAKRDAARLGLPAEGEITADALKKAAQTAYAKADSYGVMLHPEGLKRLYRDVASDLAEQGYHPKNSPELQSALDELLARGSGSNPTTLKGLEVINRMADAATTSQNAQSRLHGGTFKNRVNEFLDTLQPEHVLGGDGKKAVEALKDARELWRRRSKTEQIDALIEDAANEAAATSHGSVDAKLRQKVAGLLKEARRKPNRWSADEVAAMKDIVHQGPIRDAARFFGRFSPTNSGLIAATELGLALSHTGYTPEAIAAAIGSHAAKHFSTAATHGRLGDLTELVKRGGKRTAMSRSSVLDEARARALLGTTLGQTAPAAMAAREQRATGGKVSPSLSRIERAATRAQRAIGEESKSIMQAPDALVAKALKIAAEQ